MQSNKTQRAPSRSVAPPPQTVDPNQRYSYPESAGILRCSVPTIWNRVGQKRIAVIRDGGRSYILGAELIRYAKGEAV